MGLFNRKKNEVSAIVVEKANPESEKVESGNDDTDFAGEPQTPGIDSNFNVSMASLGTYDEKGYNYSSQPTISNTDALDIMGDHLYRYGCNWKKWFQPVDEESYYFDSDQVATGICLRTDTGKQRTYPLDCAGMDEFEWAVTSLNPAVCMDTFLLGSFRSSGLRSPSEQVAFKIRSPIVMSIMATFM